MSTDDLTRRLEDLEVRYAFQEELIQQLDQVIQQQAHLIERLHHDVRSIREQMENDMGSEAPADEQVPPHY
ncbi:MAG: lysis protein [Deltaproteobacteria bacterium]|jgi:SlyX protein|nr:lysis protein [Deltaproteobacteria bacterium]